MVLCSWFAGGPDPVDRDAYVLCASKLLHRTWNRRDIFSRIDELLKRERRATTGTPIDLPTQATERDVASALDRTRSRRLRMVLTRLAERYS